MKKTYVIAGFLTDEHKNRIRRTASECGFDLTFFDSYDEADGKVSDGEVIFCTRPDLLTQMPRLKWCQSANAGVDNMIATGVFDAGEVLLTNSSGAYGLAISEHIIMATLMLMRRMPEYSKIVQEGRWVHNLPIRSIAGSRIAIIGTGNLGSNAAKRFKALGAARVTGFSRSGRAAEGFDTVYKLDSGGMDAGAASESGAAGAANESGAADAADAHMKEFKELIAGTDVLVLCVPGTDETAGLLSRERIAALPCDVFVINVGRGSLIDQDALIEALNEGRIAGAALDVMVPEPLPLDHPLRSAQNCIITPHISGDYSLPHTADTIVGYFCENLKRYAAGLELINKVDLKRGY